MRREPVEPSFEIASWQEKTAAILSGDGSKAAFSQPVGYFLFTNPRTLAILIKKSQDAPAFRKSGKIGRLLRKLSLDPIVPGAARISLGINAPGTDACRYEEPAGKSRIAPTFANENNFADPVHECGSTSGIFVEA